MSIVEIGEEYGNWDGDSSMLMEERARGSLDLSDHGRLAPNFQVHGNWEFQF